MTSESIYLRDLLKQFEDDLTQNNAAILKRLQPGLSEKAIVEILSEVQMQNDRLIILYGWKNGIRYDDEWKVGEFDFFSFGTFLSLEDAIKHRIYIPGLIGQEHLLPIFTNGGGDYVLFNTDKDSSDFESLLLYSPTINLSDRPIAVYDSLEIFFETIIECNKRKAYSFENGELKIDFDLDTEISKRLNPKSEFWK